MDFGLNDEPERHRHVAMPIGFVTTCKTLLIIGAGRDIVPRIEHAKLFDWHKIIVMWPELTDEILAACRGDDRIDMVKRLPTEEDIRNAHVIIEDCEDQTLAEEITRWTRKHDRLINAVDKNELCDLYYMSLIFRKPLVLSITSGGDAPALAVKLRKYLEENVSEGWSTAADQLASLRKRLPCGQARRDLLRLIASDERLYELIEADDKQGIKDLIDDAILRI